MLRSKMKLSIISALTIAASSLNGAQSDLLSDIVKDMDRFRHLATVTKQNELYQPYIISVFQGKELEQLGVSDLEEALALVPGVDMSTDSMDYKTPIFRGSNPFAFGQSKLLIDGVMVNDLFLDGYTAYLSLPVEMIKRIEVVRGPGSKTDGINAYAGSINIITYAEQFKGFEAIEKVVFKGGSDDYRMGGFVKSYQSNNWRLFTDFYYQEDNKRLPVGYDSASTGAYNFPHLGIDNTALSRSGNAPVWMKNYALGIVATYGDFSIKARHMYHHQGSAYGINTHLAMDDDHTELPSTFVELGYLNVFGSYTADIKAGVKYDAFASQSKLLPDGYELPSLSDPIGTKTTYPDGFYGIHESKQRTLYQSSFLKYHALERHTISIGYRIAIEKTYDVTTVTTDRDSGTGLVDYSQIYPFFNENAKRETYTFSLQDHYEFSNALSFMYGINIEKTSLSDAQFDPRISMVYQTDPQNIYKASYSNSHRNASWQEMYTVNNLARVGNPGIAPEEVDAFELAYIRKFSSDSYLHADVFFLSNKDQIDKTNAQNEYRNAVDTDIYGLELEYKGNITQNDRFYFNYSFVNGKDSNDASLSNVAKHLAKGYYIYDVTPYVSLSGIAKYVGEKGRLSYDARSKVDDYLTFDASLRYENRRKKYTVTLSVKNMFDSEVIFPSEPMTYVGDYPQEGRTGMIVYTKAF